MLRTFPEYLKHSLKFQKEGTLLIAINQFKDNVPFFYPLKTSKNLWFSDVFRGIEVKHWLELG